ncbi:MAG TPA: GNAT family N-acetyltransferase [Dongiaceae bacterium]|jgi:putative acetyltransferase
MNAGIIIVGPADPRLPKARQLVEELDALMISLYPTESNHLVAIDRLAEPDTRFFVAEVDGKALGCGAIMLVGDSYAEVKRVYVAPAGRGLGLAKLLLTRLEEETLRNGLRMLRLETGRYQPEALGLFDSMGFRLCGSFGDYPSDDPNSIFMEKALG